MNAYGAYQNSVDSEITSSEPLELTRLLYQGAIDALRKSRAAAERQDIAERNRQASRATAIIAELARALEPERAPDLAARLAQIYEYAIFRIQQCIFDQRMEGTVEIEKLLGTLLEGWKSIPVARLDGSLLVDMTAA